MNLGRNGDTFYIRNLAKVTNGFMSLWSIGFVSSRDNETKKAQRVSGRSYMKFSADVEKCRRHWIRTVDVDFDTKISMSNKP